MGLFQRPASINYAVTPVAVSVLTAGLPWTSREINCDKFENVRVDIDISAVSTTSITFKLQFYDIAKKAWVDTGVTTAALTAAGHSVLEIGPALTTVASTVLSAVVPPRLKVVASGTSTGACVFTVSTIFN